MIFPQRYAEYIEVLQLEEHYLAFICFDKVVGGSQMYAVQAKLADQAVRMLIRDFDLDILPTSKPVPII